MTKRQILYMVLSFAVTLILILALVAIIIITDKPKVEIVFKKGTQAQQTGPGRQKGKWEDKEKDAIRLVRKLEVPAPPDKDNPRRKDEEARISINDLTRQGFFESTFNLGGLEKVGWTARYLKDSYYFVSYRFKDQLVYTGPTWLVDVKKQSVMPKDAMALATLNPGSAEAREYSKVEQQVISAITNHTFPGGINLGGIMLIHFSELPSRREGDHILGWTVVHEYDDIYTAFFQWVDDGEITYAEFEFDLGDKALRGKNLQAANIMQKGRDFEQASPVKILPTTYNPDASNPASRWTGASRKACSAPQYKDQCEALATILQDRELVTALEWLLTASVDDPDKFEVCKEDRRCRWKPERLDEGKYRIHYEYNLDAEGDDKTTHTVTWDVNLKSKEGRIVPQTRLSDMAYRAVHSRATLLGVTQPKPAEGGG